FGQPMHVEDMPESDTTPQMAKLRQKIVMLGDTFTTFVDLMRRTPFLTERVRSMGGKIEEIVLRIPAAIGHVGDVVSHFFEPIRERLRPADGAKSQAAEEAFGNK